MTYTLAVKYIGIFCYLMIAFGLLRTSGTHALLSDSETTSLNSFTAAEWGETASIASITSQDDLSDAIGPSALPSVSLSVSADHTHAGFIVQHVSAYTSISYTLTYDTDTQPNGVQGEVSLVGDKTFTRQDITLGTCTTGGACTYHSGVHDMKLMIWLVHTSGDVTTLQATN